MNAPRPMSVPRLLVPGPVRLSGLVTPLVVLIGLMLLLLAPNLTRWSSHEDGPPAVAALGVQPGR